jgi:hypothetical protein
MKELQQISLSLSLGLRPNTYIVTDGFNSSRTTSSYSCQDCFRDLEPGEVAGLENRMLVDAESPVDVDTALWRRGESSHSSMS